MTDAELVTKLLKASLRERQMTLEVIRLLREVEQRKLYLDMNYASLFEFTTKHLKYSEGAAMRRINAMRLIRSEPKIEKKIESGELSLTVAATAQNFIRKTKMDVNQVLDKIEGKSTREAERALFELAPQEMPKERSRAVSQDHTELRLLIPKELMAKLDHLMALTSHSNHEMSYLKLLERLVEQALKKPSPTPAPNVKSDTRYVPRALARQVWHRAGHKCEKCSSTYQLQIDHIQPVALGGKTELGNLRLLCRAHNLHEWRRYQTG